MEFLLVDDPTKPTFPAGLTNYLQTLVDDEICFNSVYVPRFKDAQFQIHNSIGANISIIGQRIINDEELIKEVEAWLPSVFEGPFEVEIPPLPIDTPSEESQMN